MSKMNIAILTTVINKDLYAKSAQLFPKNIEVYVIDGTNQMFGIDSIFFMMKKLKDKGIDWLIMADEDVLFINTDGIYTIIDYMAQHDYIVSGVRDGGQIPNRTYSPFVINTFFSIVNFKALERIWNPKEILKNQYIVENEFQENVIDLPQDFDTNSLYEPYYCFYFWLRRLNTKILFLDAEKPFDDDQKTTLVYDTKGKKLLYHTWYARVYGKNEQHTKRIDRIFNLVKFQDKNEINYVLLKDKTFFLKYNYKRFIKRVVLKIKVLTS